MALKSYEELIKIDVSQYCEDRDGFTYLNWAKCIELLRKNGATEVYWEPIPDPQTGSSLRKTDIEFTDKNGNTNRSLEDLAGEKISADLECGMAVIEWEELSDKGKLLVDSWYLGMTEINREYNCIQFQ